MVNEKFRENVSAWGMTFVKNLNLFLILIIFRLFPFRPREIQSVI